MGATEWLGVLGVCAVMLAVALVVIVAAGVRAVTKHPGAYDPARNAKRYTAPAFVGLGVALVASAGVAISVIGLAVTALLT